MSDKAKHTPGPWGVPDTGTALGYVGVSAGDQFRWKGMIAQCDAGNYVRSQQEGLANAYLIAAAPDLLEALTVIAAQCGPYAEAGKTQLDYATIGNLARAAIAKAESK